MDSPTEQELLKGSEAGDISTLGLVYDRYNPGIYRYAMRLLGDDCLAEDCVSETFSRFLKALQQGRGPNDHLQAYLYRIAHNWITDCYRKQIETNCEIDEFIQMPEHTHPEPQTIRQMEQEQVRLALKKLTSDQCQVVTLKFIEGWENSEIAKSLGRPIGAIKALQHRGLRNLRKYLPINEKANDYES